VEAVEETWRNRRLKAKGYVQASCVDVMHQPFGRSPVRTRSRLQQAIVHLVNVVIPQAVRLPPAQELPDAKGEPHAVEEVREWMDWSLEQFRRLESMWRRRAA
jgi:hypothetical protein